MKPQIFADTSAFLALINEADEFHRRAAEFILTHPILVTSGWVIEETLAHLHSRYGLKLTKKGIEFFRNLPELKIDSISQPRLEKIFSLFLKKGSARISIVDISNIVTMQELGLNTIFGFDNQFFTVFKLNVTPSV